MSEGSVPMDTLPKKTETSLVEHFSSPAGFLTHHPQAHKCLLIFAVILLALTAQVFRNYAFDTPIIEGGDALAAYPIANCSATPAPTPACQTLSPQRTQNCIYLPQNEGNNCSVGRVCSQGNCMLPSDPLFGQGCFCPPDPLCAYSNEGQMVKGQCVYNTFPDFFRCQPSHNTSQTIAHSEVYEGWMCVDNVCTSPTRMQTANQAYQWSINAGLLAVALWFEIHFTGDFTPELAFLALNFGVILLGWDGWFHDVGLEANNGLGRTQVAFGFILGAFVVLFAAHTLWRKRTDKKGNPVHIAIALILIFFHGVTVGQVCRAYNETFENYNNRQVVDQFTVVSNFAYQAIIFTAAVAIAVSCSLLLTGTHTAGFAALVFVTGVIELAWSGTDYNEGVNTRDDTSDFNFIPSTLALQAWGIISACFSIFFGLALTFMHTVNEKPDNTQANKHRGLALFLVIVFWSAIGLTASLLQNYYFDRAWNTFGNEMRVVGGDDNYGNQMSAFAWEHSIWAAAVASSMGIELLRHGIGAGIVALTLPYAANLVGWAAAHHATGSVIPGNNEIRPRTRAWEALCLVSGLIAFFIAHHLLRARGEKKQTLP